MGKTVGSLLTIGAALAINLIPGVGQVISGAIVGGLGGTFASVGIAGAVVSTLSAGLTLAALSSVGGLLGLGPSNPKSQAAETARRQPRPPRVSAYGESRLFPTYILFKSATNGNAIDVYAIHDGKLEEVVQYYLNDDPVTLVGDVVQPGDDGRYGDLSPPKVRIYNTDGSSPGTSISAVVSTLPGVWTINHRGDGVVIMAMIAVPVKGVNFVKVYPNGAPMASMAAKWQLCPDPRSPDPTDETQWTWTENVIRHLMHYKMVRERVDYATKIAPALDMWIEAANVCDEAVPLKAGGTEPRWRSCISHDHVTEHAKVTAAFLSTCDGWLSTRGDGALAVYAGKYYTPTVSIGPEHIVSYDWNGVGVDDDDAVNEYVCSYVSKAHDYATVECDAWRDEDNIAERGATLSQNLEVQTPSWGQVRRLAKRNMARTNAIYRGSVTTNIAGRIARGQRYINLHLEEAGTVFYSGPAEITAVTRNMATGGITFAWVATDPDIDAWNPTTEEGEPAALGENVAPEPLATPVIDTAVAELGENGSSARIRITTDGFGRDDLTWYARHRVTTDGGAWVEQEYNDVDAGPLVQLLTNVVPTDVAVDVGIAYKVGDGRLSEWSATESVSTSTANLAPAPVSNFVANGGTGSVALNWTNPSSNGLADVQIRRGTTADYADGVVIATVPATPNTPGSYNDTISAGTYYYHATTRNASAIEGAPVASGAVTVV